MAVWQGASGTTETLWKIGASVQRVCTNSRPPMEQPGAASAGDAPGKLCKIRNACLTARNTLIVVANPAHEMATYTERTASVPSSMPTFNLAHQPGHQPKKGAIRHLRIALWSAPEFYKNCSSRSATCCSSRCIKRNFRTLAVACCNACSLPSSKQSPN